VESQNGHNVSYAIETAFSVVLDDDRSSSGCPNEVVREVLIHDDFDSPHAFAASKIVARQGIGPLPIPHGRSTNLFVVHVVVTFQAEDGAHLVCLMVPSALQQLDVQPKFPSLKRVRIGVGQGSLRSIKLGQDGVRLLGRSSLVHSKHKIGFATGC